MTDPPAPPPGADRADGPDGPGALERRVALPGGEELVVRAATPGDVDGVLALYDGLDLEDRVRRFFSAYRPDRAFVEREVTAAERGGYGLVAVQRAADGTEQIVGTAGYVLLPDGDGELAATVAPGARGWLGAYLLDALLEVAAARGVANLQADVLCSNRSMLALIRARGFATLGHEDCTSVRTSTATAGTVPGWPGPHDRPRVLVEAPGGRWHAEDAARDAGLQVVVCPGPPAGRLRCPTLDGAPCPLAADADAVVVSRPLDDERWAALPAAHRSVHPSVPLCVQPVLGTEPDLEPGVVRVPPSGAAEVVEVVARVARRHRAVAEPDGAARLDP